MSNTYFQFKQFIVHQQKAAMKVCTDACLFGAWVADDLQKQNICADHLLDIGAGTGLLSLMLAQKTTGLIDAVEVDDAAASQAKENFEVSAWKERLTLHHSSIQTFNSSASKAYDVIISNPPFFEASLKSDNNQKNLAKHNPTLSFEVLTSIVSERLNMHGAFYLLLPYYEFQRFQQAGLLQGLYLQEQVHVRQTPKHTFFRTMGRFAKVESSTITTESITIRTDNNEYSQEFIKLLKDYYLYL